MFIHFNDSPPKVGGRRGMKASVTTTGDLSPLRSAEGFSPRRGGGRWYELYANTPSAPRLLCEAEASVVATNALISRWPPTLANLCTQILLILTQKSHESHEAGCIE